MVVLFLRVVFGGLWFRLIKGAALIGDADGLSIGRFELDFPSIAEHVHQFLDDLLVLLVHNKNIQMGKAIK